MDARDLHLLDRFVAGQDKPDLFAYYGLDRACTIEEADAAVKRRRQWAQGQQANPKFRSEALFLIKNQALLRRALVEEADAYRATLPPPAEPEPAPLAPSAVEALPEPAPPPPLPARPPRPPVGDGATLPIPSHSAVLPPDDGDLYAVLGAPPKADAEDLILAYRDRIRYLRFALPPEEFRVALARVESAWRVLSDPRRRAAYDAGEPVPPPSSPEREEEPPTEQQEPVTQVLPAGGPPREPPPDRASRTPPLPGPADPPSEPKDPRGALDPRSAARDPRSRPAGRRERTSPSVPRVTRLELDAPDELVVQVRTRPQSISLRIRKEGPGRMGGRLTCDQPWLDIPLPHLDAEATEQSRTLTVDPARFAGDEATATVVLLSDGGERRAVAVRVTRLPPPARPPWLLVGAAAIGVFGLGFWWVSRDLEDDATQLRLRIEPPATHVFVDGRERGSGAQVDLELPVGASYRLRVEASGHQPHEELLQGLPAGRSERRVRLDPVAPAEIPALVPLGADAQAVLAAREAELTTCYAAVGAPPDVRAEVVLFVAGSGKVRETRLEGATWTHPEAEACVRNLLSTLQFAPFEGTTGLLRRTVTLTSPTPEVP